MSVEASKQAADDAIAAVEANTHPDIKDRILNVIYRICTEQSLFTPDDIWARTTMPPEGRVLGALMRQARTKGWCERTSMKHRSNRVVNHHDEIAVWRSRIFEGAGKYVPCLPCTGNGIVIEQKVAAGVLKEWRVPSQNPKQPDKVWFITLFADGRLECTCPDHHFRKNLCKHIAKLISGGRQLKQMVFRNGKFVPEDA